MRIATCNGNGPFNMKISLAFGSAALSGAHNAIGDLLEKHKKALLEIEGGGRC